MTIRKIYRLIKSILIIVALIYLVRFAIISYLMHRYNHFVETQIYDRFLTSLNIDYYLKDYQQDKELGALLMAILVCSTLIFLINRSIHDYQNFSKDLLLFKTKILATSNLGLRRLLSLLTNISLLFGFLSLLFIPVLFIFRFPGFISRQDSLEDMIGFQFLFVFIIFWSLIITSTVMGWIINGFKKNR